MKKALHDIDSCGLKYNERFDLYKKQGFSAVAFRDFKEYSVYKEDIDEKINYGRKIGLEICEYHFAFEHSNHLWITDKVDEYINKMVECLKFCKNNNIKNMTIHASESDNPPPVSLESVIKLNKAIKAAKEMQINLCVENVRSTEHFIFVLENCDKDLKICLDTGHANAYCKDYKRIFKKYRDRVCIFHLNDNDGTKDAHKLPGSENCTFDWNFFRKNFKTINYATLESFPIGQLSYSDFEKYLDSACLHIDKVIK